MKIELAEDYEEKIFNSVMERRKKAQKIRKRVLCVVIIFTCLFGITSMSYSKFKKENYDNYFISNSENQLIEDEYEYFDGLGLKLNFINYAEDSIVIGFNIKYDDIANKEIYLEKFKIINSFNEEIIYSYGYDENLVKNKKSIINFIQRENRNEILYIMQVYIDNEEIKTNVIMKIDEINIVKDIEKQKFEMNYEKTIRKKKN